MNVQFWCILGYDLNIMSYIFWFWQQLVYFDDFFLLLDDVEKVLKDLLFKFECNVCYWY